MGVSVLVVLRLPPGHVHNYGFLLAHLRRLVGCEKQRLFSSCPPPGNSGRSPAISHPGQAFRARRGRPGHRAFFLGTRIAEAPHARAAGGRWCSSTPQPHHPDQAAAHTVFQTQIPFEQIKPDYLLWGCFRWSFASSSTPAGCLLQLKHGLDEAARDAKSG
jgi:hypothetical protein